MGDFDCFDLWADFSFRVDWSIEPIWNVLFRDVGDFDCLEIFMVVFRRGFMKVDLFCNGLFASVGDVRSEELPFKFLFKTSPVSS